jgi:hypothetical protein
MFPYNEYTEREYHQELLRQADRARLTHQFEAQPLRERLGYVLLKWGARLTVKDECQTVETQSEQCMTVCLA